MPRIDTVKVEDYNSIKVTPITGSIGAEVENVDLRDLDEDIIAELKHAFLCHKVLSFRNQDITHDQHAEYGATIGELEYQSDLITCVEGHPEIAIVESTPDHFLAGDRWHTDMMFRECPQLGAVLHSRTVPPWGGDTCWANMELAYDLLPDELKEEIEELFAYNSLTKAFKVFKSPEEIVEDRKKYPDVLHPVVRTHPETGNKCLFVSEAYTLRIDGMDQDESDVLLNRLFSQVNVPEIQIRFRWENNTVVQWDNRNTQHYAVADHGGCFRTLERVNIKGDRPFR